MQAWTADSSHPSQEVTIAVHKILIRMRWFAIWPIVAIVIKRIGFVGNHLIFMSCYQHAGQNHNTMAINKVTENVTKFRYLGTALTTRRIHK